MAGPPNAVAPNLKNDKSRLAKEGILKSLSQELREDSVLILKYFEKKSVKNDIEFLTSSLANRHNGV